MKLFESQNENRYTLTLDDDPIFYKIVSKFTGIPSLPFRCPVNFMNRANSYNPVAAFVDVFLDSDKSGLDTIPTIRERWPFVPIIVVTSQTGDGLIGKALALGANDFLRKPLDPEETLARLRARITEMSERRQLEEIAVGDVVFNKAMNTLQTGAKTAHLPDLEAKLFAKLVAACELEVPKDELRSHLWGATKVTRNSLDRKLSTIRKSLKSIESNLEVVSIYGKGVILRASMPENSKTFHQFQRAQP